MFELILSILTWIINIFKGFFSSDEKHVTFAEDVKGGYESDVEVQLPQPSLSTITSQSE
jgi:hypothetical protein